MKAGEQSQIDCVLRNYVKNSPQTEQQMKQRANNDNHTKFEFSVYDSRRQNAVYSICFNLQYK